MNPDVVVKHLVPLINNYYQINDEFLVSETKNLLIEKHGKNIDATEVTTEILKMWIDDDYDDDYNFYNLAFDIQCLLQVNGFRGSGF